MKAQTLITTKTGKTLEVIENLIGGENRSSILFENKEIRASFFANEKKEICTVTSYTFQMNGISCIIEGEISSMSAQFGRWFKNDIQRQRNHKKEIHNYRISQSYNF